MPVVGVCGGSVVPAVVLEDEMMDTKEALKELEDLTVDYGNRNEEQIARLDEAIDMAMDALRNLPNRLRQAMDTISRQALCEYALNQKDKSITPNDIMRFPSAQQDSKETSPTHKALDTISRQDAIRIVDGIDTWQAGWRGDAIESMKALPTAQPERKKGKWIPETEDWRNQIVWVKCSECGFDTSTSYNYCPNCGCRMDGGEQDE